MSGWTTCALLILLAAPPDVGAPDAASPDAAPTDAALPDAAAPAAETARALWDAARVALDVERDPGAAVPLLRRIVTDFPDSRPADRARATLGRIEELGPAAADAWALPRADEAAFVEDHPQADITPLVAIRHSTTLPEGEARALLERHRDDSRWGWAVERELGRRLYVEGHFVDAWQVADAAGDAGRVRASLRMMAWRAAPVVGVLLIAGALWWLRRRRLRSPR